MNVFVDIYRAARDAAAPLLRQRVASLCPARASVAAGSDSVVVFRPFTGFTPGEFIKCIKSFFLQR